MYKFKADPFKVTLFPPNSAPVVLETVDATGIFMSSVLDEVTQEFQRNMAPHENLKAAFDEIKGKGVGNLTKEETALMDEFVQSANRISRYYGQYCRKALKNWNDDVALLLDGIPRSQLNDFVSYLVTATLGGKSDELVRKGFSPEEFEKKNKNWKQNGSKTEPIGSSQTNGSGGGGSRKRKRRRGTHSNGTGFGK